eukprot:360508-Chlamydomonas_euryale.AAC.8
MRDAAPPRSCAQLRSAFPNGRGALEVSVPRSPAQLSSQGAALRDAPVPHGAWDSQARGIEMP